VPLLSEAARLAQQGFLTGASHRNWASYSNGVALPAGYPDWKRHLLTDPQTSGGLLIACASDKATAIAQGIKAAGYPLAAIIGQVDAGSPAIKVAD
jgi:selenide,water dikinase